MEIKAGELLMPVTTFTKPDLKFHVHNREADVVVLSQDYRQVSNGKYNQGKDKQPSHSWSDPFQYSKYKSDKMTRWENQLSVDQYTKF